jgi:acyl carrier protein
MAEAAPTDDDLFDIIAREGLVDRSGLHRDLPAAEAGIASIEVISIIFAVEDRYGVHIDENALEGCKTLGDLVDRLRSLVKTPQ